MANGAVSSEAMVVRQVFERWAISIPVDMAETFVADGGYWHAWDDHRSVSMTSVALSDARGRPVTAKQILKRLTPIEGKRTALPPGLDGWAVIIAVPEARPASHAISGIVVADAAVLIVTVTADDLVWARAIWNTIRRTPNRAVA